MTTFLSSLTPDDVTIDVDDDDDDDEVIIWYTYVLCNYNIDDIRDVITDGNGNYMI